MRIAAVLLAQLCAAAALACGEVVTVGTHNGTTMRYALTVPPGAKGALVLLPGGSGYLELDAQGCPQKLKGNSLVRSQELFQREGFATALVDAPSDYQGRDGLEDFRARPAHAEDLGKVIADLRARVKGPVWVVGTSRGSISAANAASRLKDVDGVVLTSPVTFGTVGGRKAWTAQTVYDVPLGDIRAPMLVLGHAQDGCFRSPPAGGQAIAKSYRGTRAQVVVVSGGTPGPGKPCQGRSPHGFHGIEAEVAAGIVRFVRGGQY